MGIFFKINNDGTITTGLDKNSTEWLWNSGTKRIPLNQWTHVVLTKSGSSLKTYINGEIDINAVVDSTRLSSTVSTSTVFVGWNDSEGSFDGVIDEVQVWNTGLSENAIRSWMYREVDQTHPNYNNLVLYYKLNDGSGSTAIDAKGSNHGTLLNTIAGNWVNSDISVWTTPEDTPLTGELFGSDTDGSSNNGYDWNITFEIVNSGTKGTAIITTDNKFLYTPNNNENGNDTFTYRVKDAQGSYSEVQSVKVNIEPVPESDKAITSFILAGLVPAVTGTIDEAAKTINLIVPSGTNLTALIPTIVHNGVNISPASNAAQNFSSPVSYTVTAEDGTTQEYRVSVEYPPTRIETSGGNTSYTGDGTAVIDPNLTIIGDTFAGAKAMIKNFQPGDILSYSGGLPAGVSGSWNEATGILTFTGSTSAANWQNLLRSVTFATTAVSSEPRVISFSLGNALPDNGHYYEYVQAKVDWTTARANAAASRYFGMQGYLVTITSAEENDLICQRLQANAWIGASDAAVEGDWYWVTGPEAGTIFSKGNGYPVAQNGMYMNWYKNPAKPTGPWEPNNYDYGEHYGMIYSVGSDAPGTWNDVKIIINNAIDGYVVEYGEMPGDPDLQLSADKTININRSYTVTFVNWDDSVLKTETVNYGSSATAPANPSRPADAQYTYTFAGWDKAFNNITGDLTVKATYSSTLNSYTVTFVNWDDSILKTETVNYGSAATAPDDPNREGYTFSGWYSDAELTAAFDFETPITEDTTLYAKWSVITYSITYHLNGGTNYETAPASYTVDSETIDFGTPQKTGYTFAGWYTADEGGEQVTQIATGSTGNKTLYARWTANTDTHYTVRHFRQNIEGDGYTLAETENKTGTTDESATAEAKAYPGFTENTGHAQRVAGGTILGDGRLVLSLYYDRNTYTVSFAENGGSAVDEIPGVSYEAKISKPADPSRDSYTFVGWYSDAELTAAFDFETPITGETTLYAKWNLITYTVDGFIRDHAEIPVNGVTVTLTDAEDSSKTYQATTDINGRYTLDVPDGDYVVTVTNGSEILGTSSVKVNGSDITDGSGDITVVSPTSYTVSGNIIDDLGQPQSGVKIKLIAGSRQVGPETSTDADGRFFIMNVPNGRYNLIISNEATGQTITIAVTVAAENIAMGAVTLPGGKINSVIEVIDGTPDIIVDNINDFFTTENDQYTEEDQDIVNGGGTVEIKLTIEMKIEEDAANASDIRRAAGSSNAVGIFLDLTLSKTVTPTGGAAQDPVLIRELENLMILEIPLPAELQGKSSYVIYRFHSGVDAITEQANSDGEKLEVSADGKSLKLYTRKFSTYAIAYAVNTSSDMADNDSTLKGVNRLAGANRIDTALAIAKASYKGKLSGVVLATALDYPDALAGSVLAYQLKAPILLLGSTEADQEKVLDYLQANLDPAEKVYILGGSNAVCEEVAAKISSLGFPNITRLNGRDRYETAVKIADSLKVSQGTPIVLVSGENYPDALSASSTAAILQYPVLLVKKDRSDEEVSKKIAALQPTKVYIIGGVEAINTDVESQIKQLTSLDQANIIRISGADRYNTSLAVANYFNLPGKMICVASGGDYPDALTGSVYAAEHKAPLILVGGTLSDNEMNYLKTRPITGITLFGGEAALSKEIEGLLEQLIMD